jgi:hypothetical protein
MQAIREFKATLLKQRWNPYILERISSDALQIDIATSQNIGSGWHDREDNGRWTEGNAEIYIRCPLSRIGKVELELSAPEVNVIRDWTLTLVVERLVQDEDYRFQWEAAFTSFPVRLLQRETTGIIPVNLVKAPGLANSGARGKETFRLRILSPTFSPSEYGLGRDDRQLGVFCRQVRITEGD